MLTINVNNKKLFFDIFTDLIISFFHEKLSAYTTHVMADIVFSSIFKKVSHNRYKG